MNCAKIQAFFTPFAKMAKVAPVVSQFTPAVRAHLIAVYLSFEAILYL